MKPNKSFVYCTNSNRRKMLFETEKKAENFMKFNNEEIKKESGYSPQRSYYCMFCDGWHITSKEKQLTLTTKEKLVKRYIQEHQRQNIENRDISIKIDILKCEITDFSKKKIIFPDRYNHKTGMRLSNDEIKEINRLKKEKKEIEKNNNKEKRTEFENELENQIKEMTFKEKEIFFSKSIELKKEEIKLNENSESEELEYLKLYLNVLYTERRKIRLNELESKLKGLSISSINTILFENIVIINKEIELLVDSNDKNDADIKKLYELRGELSILHQFKRIKNKNNEENGN